LMYKGIQTGCATRAMPFTARSKTSALNIEFIRFR
jgi:hypothetical protein